MFKFDLGLKTTTHQREMDQIFKKQRRRSVENIAHKINPGLGKAVQTINNMGDTKDNLKDFMRGDKLLPRLLFSENISSLEKGDHLFVQRCGYTHHGIYVGNGRVVHYLRDGVTEDSLETFANNANIQKKNELDSPLYYSRYEAVQRAKSRIGECDYNLIIRNCESFVRWCRNGLETWS